MSDRPRCDATKRNGEPCKGFALPGKDTCLAHSKTPEERRASALHAARARGVQNRAKRNEPASPFAGVHTGLTPRDVAHARRSTRNANLLRACAASSFAAAGGADLRALALRHDLAATSAW